MKRSVKENVWRSAQTGHFQTWVTYAKQGKAASPEREKVWKAILQEVEKTAPVREGERVLDIGCGLDTVLDFLDGVCGFTLDSLAAKLAELGLSPRARHSAGLFERLPFGDGVFDRVFLMNVLDHVRNPSAGLAEIRRVLVPGGVLVLSVDTFKGLKYFERRAQKWWARVRGARTKHPWVFSVEDVKRLLRGNGFETGEGVHVPGTKDRRTLFVARRS